MNQTLDFYKILQVHFQAAKPDIAAAYRRLCKLYHPDINRAPDAEERMKQINLAYQTLSDDLLRSKYDSDYLDPRHAFQGAAAERARRDAEAKRARAQLEDYFSALLNGTFDKAYHLLSLYDRQYVTLQSFCKWRRSVQRLFSMREFTIRSDSIDTQLTLEDGRTVPAKKHHIHVIEKNLVTQGTERYQATKFTILEHGGWRVYLGYRDLNEIAKMFEQMSSRQERGEMARHWEAYCAETCRGLDMLSLTGLLKAAERELYRYQRYRQPLTIACFCVRPSYGAVSEEGMADLLEATAKVLTASLRETDIPAYIGNGVFAVLMVELKKRHAEVITQRLLGKIRRGIGSGFRVVSADCAWSLYRGGPLRGYLDQLLQKFPK